MRRLNRSAPVKMALFITLCFIHLRSEGGVGLAARGVYGPDGQFLKGDMHWFIKKDELSQEERLEVKNILNTLKTTHNSQKLNKEQKDTNNIGYYNSVEQIENYIELAQLQQMLKFYPNQSPRSLTTKDWKPLQQKLDRILQPFFDYLKSIRKIDPSEFDKIIYYTSRTLLHCDCESSLQEVLKHPENYIKQKSITASESKKREIDIYRFSQDVKKGCSDKTTMYAYGYGASCTDPYLDKIFQKKDGIFDGFKNRIFETDPLDKANDIGNSPLEGCPLAAIDSYSSEVVQKVKPSIYVLGKGEAALNKPCTLLMVNFVVKDKDALGPSHEIQSLRYRGPTDTGNKTVTLDRKNNAYKLDQIMVHWKLINSKDRGSAPSEDKATSQ